MDLLKTLVLYMTMVFASSVQTMPDPESFMVSYTTPAPTAAVATAEPVATPTPTPVPTVQVSPNPDYKTLQVGDKGDEVLRLQEALTEYGYYEGEMDGRYGNQTRYAVERFQYNHGLYADGIAGKYTLSVLYDSQQVRYAQATPTPPPPADTLTAAQPAPEEKYGLESPLPATETPAPATETPSPEPSPEPTPEPVAEPEATETPAAAADDAVQEKPEVMEGWSLLFEGGEPLTAAADEGNVPVKLYRKGETLYLPLIPILESEGVLVVTSMDRVDKLEIGFAAGEHLYRLAFTESREGDPTGLEVYCDDQPLPLAQREILLADGLYYLPAEIVTELTGFTAAADEAAATVTLVRTEAE